MSGSRTACVRIEKDVDRDFSKPGPETLQEV
jgi:hypothetical protein